MSQIGYPAGCAQTSPGYNVNCCPIKEGARVRHVAWIKDTLPSDFDPTDEDAWTAQILAGNVIVISNTRGSTDGGTWSESDGFGDTVTEIEQFTEVVTYTDRNFLGNEANYNALARSKNQRVAFFSANRGWISDTPATWKPKRPINGDAKQSIYGEIEVTYTQDNMPESFIYPQSIFQCFNITD